MRTILLAALMLPLAALADHDDRYESSSQYERGRVLDVRPIYDTVRVPDDREVCWNERVRNHRHRGDSHTPMLMGGIIGGAVGSRVGDGNGRRAATVAGALLGASIAKDAQHKRYGKHHRKHRTERVCTVERDYRTRREVVAYDVEYEYNGEVYRTRTRRDPGRYIDLRVSVTPVEG